MTDEELANAMEIDAHTADNFTAALLRKGAARLRALTQLPASAQPKQRMYPNLSEGWFLRDVRKAAAKLEPPAPDHIVDANKMAPLLADLAELVERWQGLRHPTVFACADELSAILARHGDEAQKGGEG